MLVRINRDAVQTLNLLFFICKPFLGPEGGSTKDKTFSRLEILKSLLFVSVFLCADRTDSCGSLSWVLPAFPPNPQYLFFSSRLNKLTTFNMTLLEFSSLFECVGLGDWPQVYCLLVVPMYLLIAADRESPFRNGHLVSLCHKSKDCHGWTNKEGNAGWTRQDRENISGDKNYSKKGLGDRSN